MATASSFVFGCNHFRRKCKFMTPCCHKIYPCHFCHDEQESHILDLRAVDEVVCIVCGNRQNIRINCTKCKIRFGKYCCLKCNIFDDEEKNQYHCEGCGICRLDGANFCHCWGCNMCLPITKTKNHVCVENRWRANCSVCKKDICSIKKLHMSRCGHISHKTCFEKMEKTGSTLCPVCKKTAKKGE